MSCLQRSEAFYLSLCKDNNKPKKAILSTFFIQETDFNSSFEWEIYLSSDAY